MGFDNYHTKYTPDFNVGLDNLILGETTKNNHNVVGGFYLINPFVSGSDSNSSGFNPLVSRSNINSSGYYIKKFDKDIFKFNPSLEFDSPDNCLTSIYCTINDNCKDAILEGLIRKYGNNRNREWKAKGIYRTQINNKYGDIQIILDEFDNLYHVANGFGIESPTIIKDLTLEMRIVKLKTTNLPLENARKLEDNRKEAEDKVKTTINRLFNMD